MANAKHNTNNGPPKIGSWIATIILLFAFWPVGIFMLIGRLRESARYSGDYGKTTQQNARAYHTTYKDTTVRQTPPQAAAAKQAGASQSTPATASAPVKKAAAKAAELSSSARAFARLKKEQMSTKSISVVILIAAIIGFCAGGAALLEAFTDFTSISAVLNEIILGSFFTLGGAALLIVRAFIPKRVKLRRRYLAFLGENDAMKLSEFAIALARSPQKVQDDLQSMIDDGYFGSSAYIDEALSMLILDSATTEKFRTAQTKPVRQDEEMSEYERILRELRSVNDRIADASISYKIERIESTCAKIFRTVEENPEKQPQIRRFMSYYLPTTLKLLRSYATLERQGVHGENIATSKESIDNVLSKLVAGYDEQLDKLFRADAMDIGADIEVLHNMMAQDGLTESGPMAQTSTGETMPGYLDTK